MLPNQGTELADLGTLWDIDAVLVAEFLEVRLVPGIDELIGESGVRGLGAGGGAGGAVLGF